jgi:hypothetical protein
MNTATARSGGNNPAQHRGRDVEQDADNRPQHLRSKEGCRQVRLHQFKVAIQMRKDRQPRRRHRCGYQGVHYYGRFLIREGISAECIREHADRKWNQSRGADDAKIDPVRS